MGKILIADDEPHLRRILISNLKQEHHDVVEAAGVNDARSALAEHTFDAVITDQKMADGEGLDVLAAAREADPTLSVVFLTAFATIELAVESMRRGAFDFITKPFVPEVLLARPRARWNTRGCCVKTAGFAIRWYAWKARPRSRAAARRFAASRENRARRSH